jgi:ATP-dependent helicase/nuclease subunit B
MKDRSTRILLGPYRSGKSVALLTELTNHCREDVLATGDALLLVPSKRYQRLVERRIIKLFNKELNAVPMLDDINKVVTAGQELLKKRKPVAIDDDFFPEYGEEEEQALSTISFAPCEPTRRGYLGLNMESFYKACSMILRRCGVVPRVIPEAVRPALVSRVLSELNSQGKIEHLLPIVDFVGTHAALLDLIDELERSGLSPEEVIARLETSASQSSKHYELALVYKAYWDELDRIGYMDNRRIAFKCREVLAARDASTPLFGMVGVDGFDRFNHLQLQVLHELSRHSRKSTICFDYSEEVSDEARREYMWKDTSYEDLKQVFFDAEFCWNEEDSSIGGPVGSPTSTVSMEAVRTVDRFLEMEEIARKVKHALVVKRVPADEILVVVPSLRDYKGAIESAFDDAGVPYFVDDSIRMMTLPIVQFALSLLRAFENDFSRSELIRALSSRFFTKNAFGLTDENILALDRLSQKEKVIGGRNEWLRVAANLGLNEQIRAFLDCLTPPDASVPLTIFVSWCEDVLSTCLSFDEDAEFQDPVQGWTEEKALLEIQNLWASVVQEDAILYGDRGGFKSDYKGFIKKLLHAFEKANFRGSPAASNSVTISSVDLADSRRFDEVFLAGLVEGEFPRRLAGRGFVNAEEVSRWGMFGVDIHNPRMHPAFEYALFRSLLDRARKRVCLSYPMWDMSGEELLPSFFLTGESLPVTVVEAAPFKHARTVPVSDRNYIAGRLWNNDFEFDTANGDPAVLDLYGQMEESIAMVRARTEGMLESPFNGYIAESVRSGALSVKLPKRFSASRLNEYGKCPFRYWVSHVLNISPFEEASVKLEVRELGETYHLALEKFYERLIDEKLNIAIDDRELLIKYFDQSIEEALVWLEKRRGVNHSEFWEYEKKEIIFRLKKFFDKEIDRVLKSKIDFVPEMVEAAFGMDDSNPAVSAPALKITDGKRTVEFRGKIDRVDVAGGLSAENLSGKRNFAGVQARVIDYKAGSTVIPAREANDGRNMQLPIYALAVERCVMPGSRVSAGSYLSFMSGSSIGSLKFEQDQEDARGYVDTQRIEQLILDYVENMAKGVFTVKPSIASVCERCDHNRICRVSELRKGGDKNDVAN